MLFGCLADQMCWVADDFLLYFFFYFLEGFLVVLMLKFAKLDDLERRSSERGRSGDQQQQIELPVQEIDLVPSETVIDLWSIAERMVSAGYLWSIANNFFFLFFFLIFYIILVTCEHTLL